MEFYFVLFIGFGHILLYIVLFFFDIHIWNFMARCQQRNSSKYHSVSSQSCSFSDAILLGRLNEETNLIWIGHVDNIPTTHYFGNHRHTHAMMEYMIMTEYF